MSDRNYPLFLYATERILQRMTDQTPKYSDALAEMTNMRYGYEGELRADQMLRRAHLPKGSRILRDLTVRVLGEDSVQIDTLVITIQFAFILEVKNISCTLELEQQPALLKRTAQDGKVSYFQSSFVQLNFAVDTLTYWLLTQNIQIPVVGAVCLASRYAVPRFEAGLPVHFIREIPDILHNELTDRPAIIDEAIVDWIASSLRSQEETYDPFPLARQFNYSPGDLFTEPLCGECLGRLDTQTNLIGTCIKCKKRQWIPYLETLVDYFLIFGKTATLNECSKFLHLGRSKAAQLMKSPLFLRYGKTNRTSFELNRNNVRISRDGKLILPGQEE